jgi:hypothetical protein
LKPEIRNGRCCDRSLTDRPERSKFDPVSLKRHSVCRNLISIDFGGTFSICLRPVAHPYSYG